MKKIVKVDWDGANNMVPMVLICRTERQSIGVKPARECGHPEDPNNVMKDSVLKVTTSRGGVISTQYALTELQFREFIGPDKVTVNAKLADVLDLDIGSEVVLSKPSETEAKSFLDSLAN